MNGASEYKSVVENLNQLMFLAIRKLASIAKSTLGLLTNSEPDLRPLEYSPMPIDER